MKDLYVYLRILVYFTLRPHSPCVLSTTTSGIFTPLLQLFYDP